MPNFIHELDWVATGLMDWWACPNRLNYQHAKVLSDFCPPSGKCLIGSSSIFQDCNDPKCTVSAVKAYLDGNTTWNTVSHFSHLKSTLTSKCSQVPPMQQPMVGVGSLQPPVFPGPIGMPPPSFPPGVPPPPFIRPGFNPMQMPPGNNFYYFIMLLFVVFFLYSVCSQVCFFFLLLYTPQP